MEGMKPTIGSAKRGRGDALKAELAQLRLGVGYQITWDGSGALVRGELTSEQWARFAHFMDRHGILSLDVTFAEMTDLEFLSYVPWLTALQFGGHKVASIEGLAHLIDLRSLGFTVTRKFSLAILQQFPNLRSLGIGPVRDIEVVSSLKELRWLGLDNTKLPTLELLTGLPHLMGLSLGQGSSQDLCALGDLQHLELLDISYWRALQDAALAPVGECTRLKHLELMSLPHITVIPDLSRLVQLDSIWIANMRSLTSLAGIAAATNLTHLFVEDDKIDPDLFTVLRGHPHLEYLAFQSTKARRDAVGEIIQRPTYPANSTLVMQRRAEVLDAINGQ